MSFRKLAAAEGLVVHLPFLYEYTSSLLKAAAPPVLIPEGISVSTAEAYKGIVPREGHFDKLSDQPGHLCSSAIGMTEPAKPDTINDLKTMLAMPVSEWKDNLVNDFEATVFKAHPELAAINQSLYDSGAVYASMSGSGSALFALYKK